MRGQAPPLLLSLALCLGAARARGQASPPEAAPRDAQVSARRAAAPVSSSVRSLVVEEDGAAVVAGPSRSAARRGTLELGAVLPVLGRAPGEGCGDAGFYRIGEAAFVCASAVRVSQQAPPEPDPSASTRGDAMPHEYLSVKREGARGYVRPEDVLTDEYDTAFAKGFTVIARERVEYEGERFVRSRRGHYVRERDLRPVAASEFAGVALHDRTLASVGFVVADGASTLDGQGRPLRELPRLTLLRVQGRQGERLLLADGEWIEAVAVTQPRAVMPPAQVGPEEVWLDVDLERQVLVAYRGARALFATLISSGKGRGVSATPRGAHRIWVKLLSSDMRDRERHELEQRYALEAVPWVQYFEGSYGLHAAFWHDRFGEPMSRGCINLSPRDARTVFELTAPVLPAGWAAVLPVERGGSTLVVVR